VFIGALYSGVQYDVDGGVPVLDNMDMGLGESQLLKPVVHVTGVVVGNVECRLRGTEAGLVCGDSDAVDSTKSLVSLRSSIVFRAVAEEVWLKGLSTGQPMTAAISGSDTPRMLRNHRSFLFSSRTLLAAVWSSADASIPSRSQLRSLDSSSSTYSFRRARERPDILLETSIQPSSSRRSSFVHYRRNQHKMPD
jgi:hypothetical protein